MDNLNEVISALEGMFDLAIPDFSVAGIRRGSHFVHHWYFGTEDDMPEDHLARRADELVRQQNTDYATERDLDLLKDPLCTILHPNRFFEYLSEEGKLTGQSKFPRVLKGDRFARWERFLE